MVRDHRLQELRVSDRDLLANRRPEDQQGRDTAGQDHGIPTSVGIHRAHDQEFDDHHQRRHQPGHVELVEIWNRVGEDVHHRVHEHVHRGEGQFRHDEQSSVRFAMHGVAPRKTVHGDNEVSAKAVAANGKEYPTGVGSSTCNSLICRPFCASSRHIERAFSMHRRRLTTMTATAIFEVMLRMGFVSLIARALFLALMGFLIVSGTAFAHGGATSAIGDQQSGQVQAAAKQEARDTALTLVKLTKALTSQERSKQAERSGNEPCSDDGPGGHPGGDCCCKVACHSALATLTAEPTGTGDPASRYIASLSDMLVGLPADSAERPPKRS